MKTRVIRSDVEGRRDHERERAYQRRYARRHGYFWMPCRLCGEEYGGHERGCGSLPTGDSVRFAGICPSCTAERQQFAESLLVGMESREVAFSRWGVSGWFRHRVPDVLTLD